MTAAAAPSAQTVSAPVHQLRFARRSTLKLLEGFPPDKLCTIPDFKAGGACAHHVIWLMGHMATTDEYFLKTLGGIESLTLSDEWHTIFGGGSKPVADPSKYPSADELRRAMSEQHEKLVGWFASRSPEELAAPMPEKWRKYAPTLADFAFFLAWHEGYHGGQLSVLRKAFGLAPAFG